MIGSLMGAVLAAALVSMQRGATIDQITAAVRHATSIAAGGLQSGYRVQAPETQRI